MASLGDLYNDLKTLCKQWFYDKTEADGRFAPKKLDNANYFVMTDSSKELTTQQNIGNITREGKIGSTQDKIVMTGSSGTLDAVDTIPSAKVKLGSSGNASKNVVTNSSGQLIVENKPTIPSATSTTPKVDVTNGAVGTESTFARGDHQHPLDYTNYASASHNHTGTYSPVGHTHTGADLSNSTAYDNIKSGESTTLTLTDQDKINAAINTKLGQLLEADIIRVTTNKGTASASTMNRLYFVPKSGGASGDGYDIWITVKTGTSPNYSYDWEKVDDFNLQTNLESTTNKTDDVLSNLSSSTKYASAKGVFDAIHDLLEVANGNKIEFTFNANTSNRQLSAPLVSGVGDYFYIDYGDGTTEFNSVCSHTYSSDGDYMVKIYGDFNTIRGESTEHISDNLKSIIIPSCITTIEAAAFHDCSLLESVRFESTNPPTMGSNVWYNLKYSCKIVVPSSALGTYKQATGYPSSSTYTYVGWSDYTIDGIVNGDTSAVTSDAVYDALQGKLNTTLSSTVTNNGSMLVTNSSNTIGTQSIIDVLDGVVNQLINYGS